MTLPGPLDRLIRDRAAADGLQIAYRPSPNFDERRLKRFPDVLVIHYTALPLEESLSHLTRTSPGVSTHFVIGRGGELFQLVSADHRAWHAGKSLFGGLDDVNSRSIGIDLVFVPDQEDGYTPRQLEILLSLCRVLLRTLPIRGDGIVGHEHVAIPHGRKSDPGRWLDWSWLYESLGLGTAPEFLTNPVRL